MPGTWTVIPNAFSPIHTFTAPEESWLVTSHIIELPSQLYVVDAQYTLSHAREVARYAVELKKPLTRLYVTHYHPDHLLGAAAFDAPLFALASVARKISEAGDRVAREEHEKVGNDIPTKARQPDQRIGEGEEIIDGVRIQHRVLRGAETEDALITRCGRDHRAGSRLQPRPFVSGRASFRYLAHSAQAIPRSSVRHRISRTWRAGRQSAL